MNLQFIYFLILQAGVKKINRVFLTVDVEGDWSLFPNEQKHFDCDVIIRNLEILDKLILSSKDKLGIDLPVTWFIRCDKSVQVNLGQYTGLLEKIKKFISNKLDTGDSFGLHPHLYSFSERVNVSNSLTKTEIQDQLGEAFLAWKDFFGETPKFSRIGEARMCNIIAKSLETHGIKIDSTALPGRSRKDNGFNFDWTLTKNSPYNPSIYNYQIESSNYHENYNFTEVPFTMIPTKSKIDKYTIYRYLNLSFKNQIIKDPIELIDDNQDVICVVHPHEVNSGAEKKHPIISYDGDEFFKNIKNLAYKLRNPKFLNFEGLIK